MGFVRISGGTLRGRKVPLPPHDVRPTSGRAREAYFNVVAAAIEGAASLDLFTGSGIFALEAGSRGARRIVAVDATPGALKPLAALAREWNLPIETMLADAPLAVRRMAGSAPFDLVYADPPYDSSVHAGLLQAIDEVLPLTEGALVAIEHRAGRSPFGDVELRRLAPLRTSRYGNVAISYFRE
jgi:16S rRNA (guanine966-N2)-methyltransferase